MDEEDHVTTCHLYVDEAGTPDVFDRKGRSLVGVGGSSRFFMLGMLEVNDPRRLADDLTALRLEMIDDPYFATAESFKPERRKTALQLHAKDDLPEVRLKVFDVLRAHADNLMFRAVVADKEEVRRTEEARRSIEPDHRFKPDSLYDGLARALLARFSRVADTYVLQVAKRGAKDRNAALQRALEDGEADFLSQFGFSRAPVDAWTTKITDPVQTVCLQAADYFLWALQRFYEPRLHPQTGEVTHEDRYLNAIWPQVSQVQDLHFDRHRTTFFSKAKPLTLGTRFPPASTKKKRPHV